MDKKIIYFTNIPMIHQHRIDMYVDAIKGIYEVALWDLSPIYNNNEKMQRKEPDSIIINDIDSFREKLEVESSTYDVVIITNILIPNLGLIYDIIHSLNLPIVNINKDSFPAWLCYKEAVRSFSKIRFTSFINAVIHSWPISRKIINYQQNSNIKYDYQLASYNFYPEHCKSFVKIHNVKYDEFLTAQNEESIIAGDYILFIDAALADHPMFTYARRKINREEYIKSLNAYFSLLEQKYNIEVVISAHPKSNYSEDDFCGRKIIMYKTPVLIRHAKYIISHYSTSLFDAVLQKKPIKILYSKSLLESSCYGTVMSGMHLARLIGAECVNLDDCQVTDFDYSDNKYQHFINKYLVNTEFTNISNGELILRFLKQI